MEYFINTYLVSGEIIATISPEAHSTQTAALEEIDEWDGYKKHEYLHTVHHKDGVVTVSDYRPLVAEMIAERACERRHIAIASATLNHQQAVTVTKTECRR